jgi:hypothetical protein
MATPVNSSNYNDIVQIEIQLELQSSYPVNYRASGADNYVKTYWEKRFSPVNLRPN